MNKAYTFEQFINFNLKEDVDVDGPSSDEVLNIERNKWIKIDPNQHSELNNEFFKLIKTAYAEVGGHSKIQKPKDVFADPDWTYWKGIDLHEGPALDLIVFGKNTKYGVKYVGVGHDGEKESKKKYLKHKSEELKDVGHYVEMSGKVSQIMLGKYNVPEVNNKEDVEKVLGKEIEWHGQHPTKPDMEGNSWYGRKIGGETHYKIMLGKPKI